MHQHQNEKGAKRERKMAERQFPAPGSAELVSTQLNSRGLGCSHFPKYRVNDIQSQHQYPSRLGFFHATSPETRISFLDTGKLCKKCLDFVVLDGLHYWSMFSTLNTNTSSKEKPSPDPRATSVPTTQWLDATSSSDNYPRLFQAGTENFSGILPRPGNIASHLLTPPVVISIP